MKKIVLSGGPSTGKSTTFELLKTSFPDEYFVTEAAEIVIKREKAKKEVDPSYVPITPTTQYVKFVPLVIEQQLVNERAVPSNANLVFLDRSIVDNLGYLAFNGVTEYVDEVQRSIKAGGYAVAFFCDWLGKFERTEIREETPDQGYSIHQHLEKAYEHSGIPMVHLPPVNPEARLAIVQEVVSTL